MMPERAWILLPSGKQLDLLDPDPWAAPAPSARPARLFGWREELHSIGQAVTDLIADDWHLQPRAELTTPLSSPAAIRPARGEPRRPPMAHDLSQISNAYSHGGSSSAASSGRE